MIQKTSNVMKLVCFNNPLHRQNLQLFLTFTFIQHYFLFLLLFLLLLGFLLIAVIISVPRMPNIADLDVTSLITKGEKPATGTLKSCIHCNIHYLKMLSIILMCLSITLIIQPVTKFLWSDMKANKVTLYP